MGRGHRQGAATFKGHEGRVSTWPAARTARRWPPASWDKTVKLWDAATGKELATLQGTRRARVCVAFSPDGKTLASGEQDKTVKLWDAADRQGAGHPQGPRGLGVVRGVQPGRQDAGLRRAVDKTVKLWDVATGKELATLKGHTASGVVRGVQPGRQDAGLRESMDKTVKLWDVATGKELATLKGHDGCVAPWRSARTARRWPRAAWDKTIKLWDVATGKELATLQGHEARVIRGVQPGRQDAGLGGR